MGATTWPHPPPLSQAGHNGSTKTSTKVSQFVKSVLPPRVRSYSRPPPLIPTTGHAVDRTLSFTPSMASSLPDPVVPLKRWQSAREESHFQGGSTHCTISTIKLRSVSTCKGASDTSRKEVANEVVIIDSPDCQEPHPHRSINEKEKVTASSESEFNKLVRDTHNNALSSQPAGSSTRGGHIHPPPPLFGGGRAWDDECLGLDRKNATLVSPSKREGGQLDPRISQRVQGENDLDDLSPVQRVCAERTSEGFVRGSSDRSLNSPVKALDQEGDLVLVDCDDQTSCQYVETTSKHFDRQQRGSGHHRANASSDQSHGVPQGNSSRCETQHARDRQEDKSSYFRRVGCAYTQAVSSSLQCSKQEIAESPSAQSALNSLRIKSSNYFESTNNQYSAGGCPTKAFEAAGLTVDGRMGSGKKQPSARGHNDSSAQKRLEAQPEVSPADYEVVFDFKDRFSTPPAGKPSERMAHTNPFEVKRRCEREKKFVFSPGTKNNSQKDTRSSASAESRESSSEDCSLFNRLDSTPPQRKTTPSPPRDNEDEEVVIERMEVGSGGNPLRHRHLHKRDLVSDALQYQPWQSQLTRQPLSNARGFYGGQHTPQRKLSKVEGCNQLLG